MTTEMTPMNRRTSRWAEDLGRRIYCERAVMHWLSRDELSARSDIPSETLESIEAGAQAPTTSQAVAIAESLDTTAEELLPPPPSTQLDAPLRLGKVVRSRRLELGLTQKEVARQMRGAGFSTWSSSKMGAVDIGDRGTINIRELWALSVILDFDVTDVFPKGEWS